MSCHKRICLGIFFLLNGRKLFFKCKKMYETDNKNLSLFEGLLRFSIIFINTKLNPNIFLFFQADFCFCFPINRRNGIAKGFKIRNLIL